MVRLQGEPGHWETGGSTFGVDEPVGGAGGAGDEPDHGRCQLLPRLGAVGAGIAEVVDGPLGLELLAKAGQHAMKVTERVTVTGGKTIEGQVSLVG